MKNLTSEKARLRAALEVARQLHEGGGAGEHPTGTQFRPVAIDDQENTLLVMVASPQGTAARELERVPCFA